LTAPSLLLRVPQSEAIAFGGLSEKRVAMANIRDRFGEMKIPPCLRRFAATVWKRLGILPRTLVGFNPPR
jgi:hypothetical protein